MIMSSDKVLHLYISNGEVVSAESIEDADTVFATSGETIQDMTDDFNAKWEQIPDDKPITAREDDGSERTTKSAGEWAKEIGRGMAWSHNV